MITRVLKVSDTDPFTKEDLRAIGAAAEVICHGGLVGFRTETVYGLGGNALDASASARIYAAKGRPSDNPLIAHVCDMAMVEEITEEIPETGKKLAETFWPGPMTLIFKKNDRVPLETTGGLQTVAVRMPSDRQAAELIRMAGVPIAAPSANTSGRPSPTRAEHVYQDLNGKIEMILDGGQTGIGLESTIVDVTGEVPMLLRPGAITMEMLREAVGEVDIDPAITGPMNPAVHPKAPGMKYRHYAPKAPLTIVEGPQDRVVEKIRSLTAQKESAGGKVGIIATDESAAAYDRGIVKSIGTRTEEITISMHLYGILRDFDDLGVDVIYSEAFDTPRMGQAIMNRLIKAAGHQVIRV